MAHYDDIWDTTECGCCGKTIEIYGKDSVRIDLDKNKFSKYLKKDTGYCCQKCKFKMLEQYSTDFEYECIDSLGNHLKVGDIVAFSSYYHSIDHGVIVKTISGYFKVENNDSYISTYNTFKCCQDK